MSSKYDAYWRGMRDALASAIHDAATRGASAELDVSGLRSLGERTSWSGTGVLRDGRLISASMAHANSLAKTVIDLGLCAPYSNTSFCFAISAGCKLRVSTESDREPIPEQPPAARQPGVTPISSSDLSATEVSVACSRIHEALRRLPAVTSPAEVACSDGVYAFYEGDEPSPHGRQRRIARVGSHPTAGRLRGRLADHYRTKPGAKNGSVFRRYIGGALIRQDDPESACLSPSPGFGHWERQTGEPCPRCVQYEERVTEYLSQRFVFRCFRIVDQEERDHFERRIIATLAACPVCKPSPTWLGRLCYSTKVHRSGLWNSNYVDGPTATAEDLNRLDELIDETLSNERPLAATLLLIPCSKGKRAARHLSLSTRCVVDLLGERARAVLEEGRRLAFARTALDERSTQRPAIAMYSGHPYATPGFIDELVAAIRAGLHCLVISGGYGVVRAEEPIHAYEAHLPTQTRSVWASRIPVILADYVQRNGIQRTFGCFSSGYASVIPDMLSREDWRSVAAFDPITDEGAAMRAVPKKVGRRLTTLLRSGMRTSAEWSQP